MSGHTDTTGGQNGATSTDKRPDKYYKLTDEYYKWINGYYKWEKSTTINQISNTIMH